MSPRSKAFTLIELLVVISIIALLIAILLPTLRTARETARSAACASSIKQVGILAAIYYSDFEDRILLSRDDMSWRNPTATGIASGIRPTYWQQIATYTKGPQRTFEGGRPWEAYFKFYNQDAKRMAETLPSHGCPTFDQQWIKNAAGSGGTYAMNLWVKGENNWNYASWMDAWNNNNGQRWPRLDDYHMKIAILGDGTPDQGGDWRNFLDANPSPDGEFPLAGDTRDGTPDKTRYSLGGVAGDPKRHIGSANYLFIDGHVENLKGREAWYALRQPWNR